jgi:chlorite dismutase
MSTNQPVVPFTLDGSSVLHQMFQVRWSEWREIDHCTRAEVLAEATAWLASKESAPAGEQSALFAMLGHKGDLMAIHFRPDFTGLLEAQSELRGLRLSDYMDVVNSYVSVVELGLYEATRKLHEELSGRGLQPNTEEWDKAVAEGLDRQRKAMAARVWPEIPPAAHLCFYPMDKKRGEVKNWYSVPFAERQRMMHEHGLIGRKYGGTVKQIISGSIGFDDWEWGVDLFANDFLAFKQLIYEMRFDEASADYALFGPFYVGLRVKGAGLADFLSGEARKALGGQDLQTRG